MIFFYLTLYLFLKLIDKTNWQFLMGKFGSGTKHCGVNRTKPPLGGYKHTRDGKFIISPSTMAFSFHALSNLPEEKNPINFLISGLICLLFSAPYFPPPPSTRPGPFPTPQDGWRTLFLPLRTPLSLVGSRHATGSIKIVEIANGTRWYARWRRVSRRTAGHLNRRYYHRKVNETWWLRHPSAE